MGNAVALALLLISVMLPCAVAQRSAAPHLFLRLVSPRGAETLGMRSRVQVSGNERIHLNICVRARSIEDGLEQPDLAALNKGPEYFTHRPPPNVVLSVHRLEAGWSEDVTFRVISSGGGKNLDVYYVDAEIDLLEENAVRLQRAQQFVEWILEQPRGERSSQLLQASRERLVEQFAEQYIHNPEGDYEISAKYTPSTPGSWAGTLISPPGRIHVAASPDFFEVMKARLAPTIRRPN